MRDRSRVLYRRAPKAGLTGEDGGSREARGLVTRLKGEADSVSQGLHIPPGLAESPLYVFTGWAPGAEAGESLEQGGVTYTVLKAENMCLGGIKICARLLLERQVTESEGL